VNVTLEVEGLEHRYGGRRGLLEVSFALRSPGALVVTGANGSGKTTLMRALAGLLRPERGSHRLQVDGRLIPPARRFERVGLVAVDMALYEELTARENLEFFASARGLADPRGTARAGLALVGLERRADDRVGAFSSGMRQRLKLAFALQHEPALLLLDEPGSHLDEDGRALVAVLAEAQARRGLLVMATNDEREIPAYAQRVQLRGGGLGDTEQGMAK
jgi:heme exporter protein A